MVALTPRFAMILAICVAATSARPLSKRGDDDVVTGFKYGDTDTRYHSYDGYKKRAFSDAEGYDLKGAKSDTYYSENDHYGKRGDDNIVTGFKYGDTDTRYHSYDGYRKRGDDDIVTGFKYGDTDTRYHSYDEYKKREVSDAEGYDLKSLDTDIYYVENDHYGKRGDDDIVTGFKYGDTDTRYHSYDGYKKREMKDAEGYDLKTVGSDTYYNENDKYEKRGDDDVVTGFKYGDTDTRYHSYDGYKRSV